MKDLIEALQILFTYNDSCDHPTHCEHDVMYISSDYQKDDISSVDIAKLDSLGFHWDDDSDGFISYKIGSC